MSCDIICRVGQSDSGKDVIKQNENEVIFKYQAFHLTIKEIINLLYAQKDKDILFINNIDF